MPLRRIIRYLLLLALCGGAAFFAWRQMQPKPVAVAVKKVARGKVERLVANTRAGTVKACRQANLSPGVGGQIAKLPIKKGDQVSAGQLLVEVWNNDLAARMKLAESDLAAASSRLESMRQQAAVAKREADRLGKLRRATIVSEEQFDQSATQAKVRQADYAALLAAEKTARDQFQVIAAEFERTRLLAPFAGIVAEVNGELNEYVTPSPPGIPTPPTVILLDTSCFYVTAPIDEVDAAAITVGMPARITLDAFGDRVFQGRVRRIDPYVLDREKQARTVEVEVAFDSPAETVAFLSGYSADVEIVLEVHDQALRVPTQAVLEGKRVFVFNAAANRLQQKEISAGISNWDVTEVLGGLREGESVVLSTDRAGVKDNAKAVAEAEP